MGLIKHFNDLLAYLMTFEKALEVNPFQEHPAHLSGRVCSLEAACSATDGGPVLASALLHHHLSRALLSFSHVPNPLGTKVCGAAVLLPSGKMCPVLLVFRGGADGWEVVEKKPAMVLAGTKSP